MKYRIGFVGVGLMGSSLAKHLLSAGFPVVVHDIDPVRQKGIEMLDATISGTSDMCAIKDTIFMVGGKEEIFKPCEPLFAAMSRE